MGTDRKSTAWRDYQSRAAELFSRMGFDAAIEEIVEGARGRHEIDVVVRMTLGGVAVMWIVECKYWKSAVPKAHVLTLAQIAQDVGADRAVLLSETGFQAGAISIARNSNVLLTSLDELGSAAADSIAELEIRRILSQVKTLEAELQTMMFDYGPRVPPTPELDELISLLGACLEVTLAVVAVQAGRFPVRLPSMFSPEARWAEELPDISGALALDVDEIAAQLATLKPKIAEVLMPYVDCARELIYLVRNLMDAGAELLEPATGPDSEELRLQVVLTRMRAVGASAETLRSAPSAVFSGAVSILMRQLIDGPYLWFGDPKRKRETWEKLKTQTDQAVAGLADAAGRIEATRT